MYEFLVSFLILFCKKKIEWIISFGIELRTFGTLKTLDAAVLFRSSSEAQIFGFFQKEKVEKQTIRGKME